MIKKNKGYSKKYLFFSILWIPIIHCSVDLTIPCTKFSDAPYRSVDLKVTTHLGAGFFAEFLKVVNTLIHHEPEGLASVHVDWTYEFFPYKDGPHENGWNLYFEPITIENKGNDTSPPHSAGSSGTHEIHDQICSSHWISYDQFLPYRTFVHEKLTKYIHIKKEIKDRVDTFYDAQMQHNLCIGVHVRFANGHSHEVPGGRHPTLAEYFHEVDTIMQANRTQNTKIFIASDSHYVVNQFKQRYGKKILYIEAFRAEKSDDPHLIYGNADYFLAHPTEWHRRKPGFNGGLTALLDCLLLARCNYLIHTSSNVSSTVVFFNPTIKSVYLPRNAPYISCRHKNDPGVKNPFLNPA